MAAVMAVPHESVVSGTAAHSGVTMWSPEPTSLKMLVSMLHDTLSPDANVQKDVYRKLESYAMNTDFSNYLVHILAHGVSPDACLSGLDATTVASIRRNAGVLLKGNVVLLYRQLPHERQTYINSELLRAAADDIRGVRSTAALCIVSVVEQCGLGHFPGLINWLRGALASAENPSLLQGGLTVLCRLSEDLARLLQEDTSGSMEILLPMVIELCGHQDDTSRVQALQIVNHHVVLMPTVMHRNIERYCRKLFDIAEDDTVEVRKHVCTAICLLMQSNPEALEQYMPNILQYMLVSSKHPDEQVALEAGEFWIIVAHLKNPSVHVRNVLPQIVELLVDNIVWNESDRARINASNVDNDMVPDKPEDIRPRFHSSRIREHAEDSNEHGAKQQQLLQMGRMTFVSGGNSMSTAASIDGSALVGGDDDSKNRMNEAVSNHGRNNSSEVRSSEGDSEGSDNDTDDIDWDSEDGGSEWSVRKCSAEALDALTVRFTNDVLNAVLPRLNEKLQSERWEYRECAVLVLGVIANGSYKGVEPRLPQIFPYIMHLVTDSHYMVRCVACWTLSQYARWVVHQRRNDERQFDSVLAALLKAVADRNKKVQRAACSALAVFEEEAGPALNRYVKHILPSVMGVFGRYQARNITALYDVISTLADAVGSELADAEHLNILMPPLISKWNSLADTDKAILGLLECLASVFRAIGASARQFAPNVLARCVNIIDAVYKLEAVSEMEDIHAEFLACSLDCMSGLAEAIGLGIDPLLVNNSNGAQPALPLLFMAMRDARPEVRQNAFTVMGEFGRSRLPSLIPALHEYVQCIIGALNPEYMSVSNNATWALGEMVMMAGFLPSSVPIDRDVIKRALVEGALGTLISTVNSQHLTKSLLENTAITLGRMGLVIPDSMAPKLGTFVRACFTCLRDIRDDIEKEQAAHGMNALIRMNPTAICECFPYYVDSIASWYHCKSDLEADFAAILVGFKNSLGDQWFALFRSCPPVLQNLLKERFKL